MPRGYGAKGRASPQLGCFRVMRYLILKTLRPVAGTIPQPKVRAEFLLVALLFLTLTVTRRCREDAEITNFHHGT